MLGSAASWSVIYNCSDFHFEPNGLFHLGYVHGDVRANPPGANKDSLVLSVGKCQASQIRRNLNHEDHTECDGTTEGWGW